MANIITPVDACYLFEEAYKQATGRTDIDAIDTSNFVAVAETLNSKDNVVLDNFWGALIPVMVRTVIAVRSYSEKFNLTTVGSDIWGGYIRKITFLYTKGEETMFNKTDINPDNLKDGTSVDRFKIKSCKIVSTYMFGRKTFQDWITLFETQVSQYFSSAEEWAAFISGMLMAFDNKQKKKNELWKRLTVVNKLATAINQGHAKNLVKTFNDKYVPAGGTRYTMQELQTKMIPALAAHFVKTILIDKGLLTEMAVKNHENLEGFEDIDRFTPEAMQRMYLHNDFYASMLTEVYPNLFNEQFLQLDGQYELVNYWQSIENTTAIECTPNQLDPSTGKAVKGDKVECPYVVAALFDVDALATSVDYKRTRVTPLNEGGEYRNVFFNWDFLSIQDDTENFIVYYMADEEEPPVPPVVEPSITLNKSTTTIAAGSTETLTATTVPADAEVTWTSSDTEGTIATVEDGVVTAVGEGSATITASITVDDVAYTDTCAVTVTAAPEANTRKKSTK